MKITIIDTAAYLDTPYNPEFVSQIKNIGGARWDSSRRERSSAMTFLSSRESPPATEAAPTITPVFPPVRLLCCAMSLKASCTKICLTV